MARSNNMKILMLDIETAPHRVCAWGFWDQNIGLEQIEEPGFTLCWAAKWYKDRSIKFSSIHTNGNEAMLQGIYDLIEEADAVVHYNGTRFDMPTLNQEFLTSGLGPPAPYQQIDLLRTARSQFRLPSNKLNYVARHLGVEGKYEHKGMRLWKDCMAGDDKAWKTMEKYNKQDVNLLEQVYEEFLPWITNHPNQGLFTESTDMVCPNCGGKHLTKRGHYYTKTMHYQRLQCQDCGTWTRMRTNDVDKEKRKSILIGVK